ncbi:DUF5333 domain-containing protein [Cognatishimia activa]|uniref:DUF5333 domain-containing protein n=1 Tax=Cognatishimia activa TaxID=1715691 RepID=A0A975I7C9_9RHOB|nr:DUF5333 domain-containing protein [Cognatishimia activa]QTN35859.1 DUF5333 domain-containing protein [Cognatishimia activa]
MRMMLIAGFVVAAGAAQAKQDLKDVPSVWNGLLNIGIANEIRETCPSISARMVRAALRLNSIQNEAEGMGYSQAEIDAFRKSEANKAAMRAEGEAYMKNNGVVKGDAETYCALGRAEIAKSSQIGRLLRAN